MSVWNADEWAQEVEQMTAALRGSTFPLWVELREQLRELGVDSERALLVESYDEPPHGTQHGVVVTADARVLAYEAVGAQWDWTDLSDRWEGSEFGDQISVGLTMLAA